MNSITKSYALILIGIMAISCMSLLTAQSVSAQTIPRPSVPEFTSKVVDTNLEVTIKNQPLTPYENGSYPSLYYMFRFKDNNTRIGYWDYDPMYYVLPSTYGGYHKASNSDFTTVSLSLDNYQYPSGQIDIQVIALIGNQYPTNEQRENRTVYAFEGETSDWSNPQYITILASSSQNRALDFIENVLPIDSTQWQIKLVFNGNATDIDAGTNLIIQKYNVTTTDGDMVLRYDLASMVGTADYLSIVFIVRDNIFTQAIVDIDQAPTYSTFGRPLQIANVTDFLANYQSWSGFDSTKMKEMLSNVNLAQNTSISSDNLTVTITSTDSTTKLSWTFSNSHKFEMSFKNNLPTYFYDDRQIDYIPTPTSPPEDRNPPHLDPIYYLIPISVIVAVVILSVLLFRWHRKTMNKAS